MTAREALIIGGGIGGPVAAMALQRAGIKATIYEAWDHAADYTGWFLNTASNGLDVLHTLGIDLASRADGHPMPNMVMWSGTGKRLGEVANGIRLEDGTVSVCIKRGELQRVLREETLGRGIRIEYGKQLARYEPTGDGGVAAMFADGTTAEGGLLVGADGIHSATRQLLVPGSPEPAYTRPDRCRRLQPQHHDPADPEHPALRVRQAGLLRLPGPGVRTDLVVRQPRPP